MDLKSSLPNLITYCNLLSGIGAIIASTQQQFTIAAWLLFFAIIFDYSDGKLARKLNVVSEFGKELDSLCDIVSFIIAPVVFALTLGYNNIIALIIYVVFVIAGATRLARFNANGMTGNNYKGVPVPYSISIILLHFLFIALNIHPMLWVSLFAGFAILMLAPLNIPKF